MSMATALAAEGQRLTAFIYAGRSRDQLAFLGEIEGSTATASTPHRRHQRHIFDVRGLLAALNADEPLYLCGPEP